MRNGIKITAVMAVGILAAGCATSGKGKEANLTDTRVAALEARVTSLQQRLDEVSQGQQAAYPEPVVRSERPVSQSAGKNRLSVKQIQQALVTAGYYQGTVDGKLGPQTRKAIKNFQEANGLKADGLVGPSTTEALAKYLPE